MLDQHYSQTKGLNVPICTMPDKYLRNVILKYLREVDELKARIESVAQTRGAAATTSLMEEWVRSVRRLYPYLSEALLRNDSPDLDLTSLRAALQKTIGRSAPAASLRVAVTFSAFG
jgi:hypothetical protein